MVSSRVKKKFVLAGSYEILRLLGSLRMTGKGTFAEVLPRPQPPPQSVWKNLVERRITAAIFWDPSADRRVGSKR